MATVKYVNKTVYDQTFFKKAAWYQTVKGKRTPGYVVLMAFFLIWGTQTIQADNSNIYGWIYSLIGLIVIPVIGFLVPYKKTAGQYAKMHKRYGDQEFVVKAEIDDKKIHFTDYVGEVHNYNLTGVSEVVEDNGLFIIRLVDDDFIFLSQDGFVGCDKESVKAHIEKIIAEKEKRKR